MNSSSLRGIMFNLRGEEDTAAAALPRGVHGLPTAARPLWTPSSQIGAPFRAMQWSAYDLRGEEWHGVHGRLNLCNACIFTCTFFHDKYHCMQIIMSSAHGVPLIVAMGWGTILVCVCVSCVSPPLPSGNNHMIEP